jgi:hypothetical protein
MIIPGQFGFREEAELEYSCEVYILYTGVKPKLPMQEKV